MKNFTRILSIIVIGLSFSASAFAQVSATATAAATIVSPIAITKATDMNFGNVASSAAAGTVVLAPGGGRTANLGVTLPATVGTVSVASFNVSGTPNYTYSITLPAGATTITSGGNSMTVDTWTSSPTVAAGGLLSGAGTQTLNVGATLNVGISQAAGSYSSQNAGGSGPFTVQVNYN
jgi:hypothetical protein